MHIFEQNGCSAFKLYAFLHIAHWGYFSYEIANSFHQHTFVKENLSLDLCFLVMLIELCFIIVQPAPMRLLCCQQAQDEGKLVGQELPESDSSALTGILLLPVFEPPLIVPTM
jgi:hypothetical protein